MKLKKIIEDNRDRKKLNEAGKFAIDSILPDLLPSSKFFLKNKNKPVSKSDLEKYNKMVDDITKLLNNFYKKNNIPWQYYRSKLPPKLKVDDDSYVEDDEH
jgi:hypothetical protein